MLTAPADLRLALDLVGIFAFAISGGLVGVRARLDLFGVAVLAWATGLGGGILRDLLLGDVPPAGISEPRYIITVLLAGLAVVAAYPVVVDLGRRRPRLRLGVIGEAVKYLDAVGLAVFSVAGALKALILGAPPLACIVVGVLTAVGGGAIRDVLVGQVPEVLRREVYAVPALLGATTVVAANQLEVLTVPVVWAAVALVLGIRIAAIIYDLQVPTRLALPTVRRGRDERPPRPHGPGDGSRPDTRPDRSDRSERRARAAPADDSARSAPEDPAPPTEESHR
ncbi:TRIC cation channel family protein [Ornithinimicrobium sp. W1679]|uniref:trimeric intracellular cation channel family protein n=1 Tax=unclassified Ornithinimicrobium TaxID=2615080 RepID=UPI003CF4DCC0